MENEYRFTFVRHKSGAMEKNSDTIKAKSLEDAAAWAEGFCKRHKCQVCEVEWYDPESQRWQISVVQYA